MSLLGLISDPYFSREEAETTMRELGYSENKIKTELSINYHPIGRFFGLPLLLMGRLLDEKANQRA